MTLLFLVLAGFLLAVPMYWICRVLGERAGYLAALLPAGLTWHFARHLESLGPDNAVFVSYPWVESLGLSLSFYLDGLSLLFCLVVTGVGTLICIYARGYFAGHPRFGLFYAYIFGFMSSMLGTVLAGNLLTLYVFWELTTLSSFLLIGFEHDKASAREAARQSLLVTAGGGLAMLAGLVLLGIVGNGYEIPELLQRGEAIAEHSLALPILLLLLVGVATKSAQFPFHFWLPNAMAAPTPVSAYLHSATMVKLGVYLLARFLPVFGGTDEWRVLVTSLGAVTMFVGAYLAFFAHDLKAVLAYLTVNVLGTLVMLLGIGTELAAKAAMTYLLAHALYKGALFLMAGVVDHQTHTRDLRELGGLWRKMPVTAVVAALAALSMAGVMPLFGFVAKELYFEAVEKSPVAAIWLTTLSVISSIFLIAGAVLVGAKPFYGESTEHARGAHEAKFSLLLSPVLLVLAGVFVGLFPGKLASPFVEQALTGIQRLPTHAKLSLWHGITPAFLLSTGALVGGIVLYLLREPIHRWSSDLGHFERWKLQHWYQRSLTGLQWVAGKQTALLQTGYLRRYVTVVLLTTSVLVLAGLWRAQISLSSPPQLGVRVYEGIAAALTLVATIVTVMSRSRFRAVTALGIVGINIAWLFQIFGAPDLAMTQFVVEALTVVLFVLAFSYLPTFSHLSTTRTRVQDAVVATSTGALITVMLLLVTAAESPPSISQYFAEQSYELGHGKNVVNVILVDFRAFDTLGEITVLSTAAVGAFALIKLVVPSGGDG